MLTPVGSAPTIIDRRRTEVERQFSIQDGVARVNYQLSFTGAGESAIEVNFPVRFITIPAVYSGFTLDPNTVLENRNFPWASAGVVLGSESIAGRDYFTSGTIIVVMGGTRTQKMTVHCSVEGKAVQGPTT